MAFGLYKPGQGYWVRVMTAAMAGVLVLVAAAWLFKALQVVRPPVPSYEVVIRPATGSGEPGRTIALLTEPVGSTGSEQIGTAVVKSVVPGPNNTATVVIEKVEMTGGRDPATARRVGPAGAEGPTLAGPIVGRPQGRPLFEPLYIQATGAGVVLLGGAILIYWLVGVKPGTSEFLIATDGEMKKVNWSTRKHILDSTWVVIAWSVLLAGGLYAVDLMFSSFFKLIRVLE
jgi:preprotein translocase SecE subunit